MLEVLALTHQPTFLQNYLQPALVQGLVEMTQSNSPRSPTQKYHLTDLGKQVVLGSRP
jgi:ATP-dependent DNA helicase RecG